MNNLNLKFITEYDKIKEECSSKLLMPKFQAKYFDERLDIHREDCLLIMKQEGVTGPIWRLHEEARESAMDLAFEDERRQRLKLYIFKMIRAK